MLRSMTIYDFEGKVALVTGGAGGIGSATVRQLAAGGARVAIADRDEQRAQLLADELGEPAMPVRVDISDEADVDRCADAIVERFGRIDLHLERRHGAKSASPRRSSRHRGGAGRRDRP